MIATKMKVAYTLFLLSFSMWIFLTGIALFPAIRGFQIQFPNIAVQSLFLASAATSTAGCLLIGFHFLGFGTAQKRQTEKARFVQGKLGASAAPTIRNELEDETIIKFGEPQETKQTIEMLATEGQEELVVKKRKK